MATRPGRDRLNAWATALLLVAAVAVAMMPLAHAAHGPGHDAHAAAGAADHHADHAHHEHEGADCDESDPAHLLHELMECDCLLCKAGQASAVLPDPLLERRAAALPVRLPPPPRTAARTYRAQRPPTRAPPASGTS